MTQTPALPGLQPPAGRSGGSDPPAPPTLVAPPAAAGCGGTKTRRAAAGHGCQRGGPRQRRQQPLSAVDAATGTGERKRRRGRRSAAQACGGCPYYRRLGRGPEKTPPESAGAWCVGVARAVGTSGRRRLGRGCVGGGCPPSRRNGRRGSWMRAGPSPHGDRPPKSQLSAALLRRPQNPPNQWCSRKGQRGWPCNGSFQTRNRLPFWRPARTGRPREGCRRGLQKKVLHRSVHRWAVGVKMVGWGPRSTPASPANGHGLQACMCKCTEQALHQPHTLFGGRKHVSLQDRGWPTQSH